MAINNTTFLFAMDKVRAYWKLQDPAPVLHAYTDVSSVWAAQQPAGTPMPFTLQELIDQANIESVRAFTLIMQTEPEAEARAIAMAETTARAGGAPVLPYGGKGIREQRNAVTGMYEYVDNATGQLVPFDPAKWDAGQGSNNHGEPGLAIYAKAYAQYLGPWVYAMFVAANPGV